MVRPRFAQALSPRAAALADAEATEGIVVSVATLVDLWYVTQTTQGVSAEDLTELQHRLRSAAAVEFLPLDVTVVDGYTSIPRDLLTDPWDRFIVATAAALAIPLVTRDRAIEAAQLVQTIW